MTLEMAAAAFLLALGTLPAAARASRFTPVDEARRGTMATVRGAVERITDEDGVHLSDETDSIRVRVGPDRLPAEVGETVTLEGFVDGDLGPREICARSLVREDGTIAEFDRRCE